MKLVGLLLMPSGWIIVLAALVLLPGGMSRVIFTLAGIAVEAMGLALMIRTHARLRGDER